jgi:3-hydroxyacyl-CoA dehydrogenase
VNGGVRIEIVNAVAVLEMVSPPVNVLTHALRVELSASLREVAADSRVSAIALLGDGKYFISGADLKEFETGLLDPTPAELANQFELASKPIVAALTGQVLGVGLELAMACHFRMADPQAKFGMPEMTLGVVPGAGGTQRLPRLIGTAAALDLLLTGQTVDVQTALQLNLIDEIAGGDLRRAAIRRTRDRAISDATPGVFAQAAATAQTRLRGRTTPELTIAAVQGSTLPFSEGLAREADLVRKSFRQTESLALRHLFFAEREAGKLAKGGGTAVPRDVSRVAVVGSGTMGGGIAMCFADIGTEVMLIEVDAATVESGIARIRKNYQASAARGRLSESEVSVRLAKITATTRYEDAGDCDLLIEAVPEKMSLKQSVFRDLDRIARPGAILATNTSTLDINEIAAVTRRPADVVGLHFFSPANVMKLLEIVRTDSTAPDVIATAFALARRIRKVGVLSKVCYGFIGNRMMDPYAREAERAVLDGASPGQVDAALEDFGMAMGILAVFDLAGVDVAVLTRRPSNDPTYYRCSSVLYQQGWMGQKTGKGFYAYEGRKRQPNPQAEQLFREEARRLNVEQNPPTVLEIQQRCLYGMVNEGARILEEGIAQRASDIDVVYTAGYGFPRHRGGPMFWADNVGLDQIVRGMNTLAGRFGSEYWTPAPLLADLARTGRRFSNWSGA